MFRKLFLRFVDDENDLHRGCVVVNCNILILYLVGNNLEPFFEELAVNINEFRGFWLKAIS